MIENKAWQISRWKRKNECKRTGHIIKKKCETRKGNSLIKKMAQQQTYFHPCHLEQHVPTTGEAGLGARRGNKTRR